MNRKGWLIRGMALAVILGAGLMAPAPGVSAQTLGAQDHAQGTLADQTFRLDWTASSTGNGATRITGYIYNDSGDPADQVHLRITALDASGKPIGSFVEPVDDVVPNFDRAYFDVHVPGHAASYKVAVDSFNIMEGED